MKKTMMTFASIMILSSCSIIHKMDIEQGNIITPEMTHKIHPGMSQAQVEAIMGSPVLMNTFNDDRTDYVYTFKTGRGNTTEKRLILSFRNGNLTNMQ